MATRQGCNAVALQFHLLACGPIPARKGKLELPAAATARPTLPTSVTASAALWTACADTN
jgi:hypothetical protein